MQSFYGKDSEGEEAWGINGKEGIPKKYLRN